MFSFALVELKKAVCLLVKVSPMHKILCLFLTLSVITEPLKSQILPNEGNILNYRLVGFSFPPLKGGVTCILEIADGNYSTENSFKTKIIKTISFKGNKKIIEVPFWGEQYTWRTIVKENKAGPVKSELHHFSTILNPDMDTSNVHLIITQKAKKYKDALVLLDNLNAMYDMAGNPVWFLPGNFFKKSGVRDLKISPQGTITFIAADKAYEVNYSGDIIWQGPNTGIVSGDSSEHYHHELTKLANGHYMILGDEPVVLKQNLKGNSSIVQKDTKINSSNDSNTSKLFFGTLIEYDANSKVVWYWKSSDYFLKSGLYQYQSGLLSKDLIDVHANSFFFDEKNKLIYISFKNINCILKIKYPEGTVLNNYSDINKDGIRDKETALFCGQHSIRHSDNGYLYLFNNNSCNHAQVPAIMILKEGQAGMNHDIKKIWEYNCVQCAELKQPVTSGGNAIELSDNSFFVNIGMPYSDIFIVSRDKKILWSARAERRDPATNTTHDIFDYRASITTNPKDIEKLIWNSTNSWKP